MIIEAILLSTMTITSYRAVPAQTKPGCDNRHSCETSIGDGLTMYGVAASQDLLREGVVHYGDIIWIDRYGYRVVNDAMGVKARRAFDMFVFDKAQEHAVGVRRLRVWLLPKMKIAAKEK